MGEQTADVLSESRVTIFTQWRAKRPIRNYDTYAAQVARSVVRQLRRQLPRVEGGVEELLTTELPTRTPFDVLVANAPSPFLPKPQGKVQAAIEHAVCSGTNLECLCSDPKRLVVLRHDRTQCWPIGTCECNAESAAEQSDRIDSGSEVPRAVSC